MSNKILEEKHCNFFSDNYEEIECIEIPFQSLINKASLKSEKMVDLLVSHLIQEMLEENVWKSFVYFMFNEAKQQLSDKSEANTIYGIRTNTNAVREYCILLINYLEE